MSGSSVRCLIVKDPKPGDWKMTMTVPEGVGFHCECNTVPSKDPYKTITDALSKTNQLQKRGSSNNGNTDYLGWYALYAVWLVINVTKDVIKETVVGAITGGAVGAGVGLAGAGVGSAVGATIGALAGALGGAALGLVQGVTATSRQMTALAQANAALPGELRIATWNVFHGDLPNGGDRAYNQPRLPRLQDRVNELVNFGARNNLHLIAFQEMPQLVLNNPNHAILTNIRNSHYDYVIVNSEYPGRIDQNADAPSPNTPSTGVGYLILYNPQLLALQNPPAQHPPAPTGGTASRPAQQNRPIDNINTNAANNNQVQYFQPWYFLNGIYQARPPVQLRFQITANQTVFDFLTWHTEESPRSNNAGYVQTAYDLLGQQQGNWIIAGDLNADDQQLTRDVTRSPHHLTADNLTLDHIITSGTAIDPEPNNPRQPGRFTVTQQQWGRFWSDAHYVLFGIVRFP